MGATHDDPLVGGEAGMNQTIVGDDIRHREHPIVAGLGEHVRADAGQGAVRRDQLVVHLVHPARHRAGAGQVEVGHRGAGQHARLGAGGDQRADRVGVQAHIGIQVDAREGGALGVAHPQRVGLAGHLGVEHPDALDGGRGRGGAVLAGVRDHDDVELAGLAAVEQPAQVARDDCFLVVGRNHDADCWLGHAGQDNHLGRTVPLADRSVPTAANRRYR